MLTSANSSPGGSRRSVSCYNTHSTQNTACVNADENSYRQTLCMRKETGRLGGHDFFKDIMAAFINRTILLKLGPKDCLLFQNLIWLWARKPIYYRNDDH